MKASTLFVISIALLVGLGAFGVAKYVGVFKDSRPTETKVKEEPILVLVPITDLYKGVGVTGADVRVRELHPSERAGYEQNPGEYMPPFVSAAHLRITSGNIRADQPLKRSHFVDTPPEPVSLRIQPGMRSVNVAVTKEHCAGGVIQVGEYVDVWLTAKMNDPADPGRTMVQQARLDRNCRVIMKRNNLKIFGAADAEGAPISFTLEANPYRAALIDYAKMKGELTLFPAPPDSREKLRVGDSSFEGEGGVKSYGEMTGEYIGEDKRVDQVKQGLLVMTDNELKRIFRIQDPPSPIVVTNISGITPVGRTVFGDARLINNSGARYIPAGGGLSTSGTNTESPQDKKDCPTCGKGGDAKQPVDNGIFIKEMPKK